MKKTLVALAALAATSAFAQSSVTIYGNLDQGIYRQTEGNNTNYSKIASNVNSTSVLGFRGTEDLGGGTTANFHLLSELSLSQGQMGSSTSGDTATTGQKPNIFTRAANVSLANKDMGSFEIGRIQDTVWLTQGAFNNVGSNSFGFGAYTATQTNFGALVAQKFGTAPADTTYSGTSGATGVANQSESGSASVNFNAGWGYTTPTFYGVKATYQHVGNNFSNTAAGNPAAATGNAYRVEYTNGPLNVQYAQTSRQDAADKLGAKWQVLGATYQMGAAKLVAAQSKLTTSNGFSSIDGNTVNALGVIYDLNAKVNVGAGYTTIKDDVTGNKSSLIGLTGRYMFSKRTQAYAGYGRESNDGTLKTTMLYGGPSSTSAAGSTSQGYLVGIRHSF